MDAPLTAGLLPTDSMQVVVAKTLRFQWMAMRANEAWIRAGQDAEALHDLRVAVRRSRSAFKTFKKYIDKQPAAPHKAVLRTLGKRTNPARDLDVQVKRAARYQLDLPVEHAAAFAPLFGLLARRRAAARDDLLSFLDSSDYLTWSADYDRAIDLLSADTETPALGEVARIVRRCYTRARNDIQHPQSASLHDLHQLRIRMKELRYAVEFFADLLGEPAQAVILHMKTLQDQLGDLNDTRMALALLDEVLGEKQNRNGNEHTGVEWLRYRQASEQQRDALIAGFAPAWQTFSGGEFQALLEDALRELAR